MRNDISKLINIVKKRENIQWEIGDELISILGPPGQRGPQDGSYDQLWEISAALAEEGYEEYSFETLRKMRRVSDAFHDGNRLPSYPWSFHMIAGNPKTLRTIVERARIRNTKLTQALVKVFKKEIEEEEKARGEAFMVLLMEMSNALRGYKDKNLDSDYGEEGRAKIIQLLVGIQNEIQALLHTLDRPSSVHLRAIGE
jgi:hypothetical protein